MLTSSNWFFILVTICLTLIWVALMASVYYGILCCQSSMWMLEIAIQGDVCKGLDGVIKTEETHIKCYGFLEWVWRCTYVHTFLYVLVRLVGGVKTTSFYELCLSSLLLQKFFPLNHSSVPSLVGSAFWENSNVEETSWWCILGYSKALFFLLSCPWSHILHLVPIWNMFIYD